MPRTYKKLWIFVGLLILPVFAHAEFGRDLYFGLRGDPEVVRLQEFLREGNFFTYPQVTGNFFGLTREAVRQFQIAHGITPSSGYFGPRSRAVVNGLLGGGASGSGQGSTTTFRESKDSPYKDKIVITSLSGTGATADSERLTIENKSSFETVSVTGFTIENARGGSFAIPKGFELPGSGAVAGDPIRLRPGDQLVISLGKQERQMNFRENICTGYFDELSKFSPSLSHRCPRVDVREFSQFSDRCIQQISGISSCRMMRTDEFTDSACAAFAQEHFTYAGCVRDHRERPDFYLKRWLVWMQRTGEFFRNTFEQVTLRDQEGRVVAEHKY